MASPITVRLTETLEALLREQAAEVKVGPSTFARQLLETALFAAASEAHPTVDRGGSAEHLTDRDRVLELLLVRVSLLEELLLTLVSKHVGGDRDERQKKVETYFARAEARATKKAKRLLAGENDGARPGGAGPTSSARRAEHASFPPATPSTHPAPRPRSRPAARRPRAHSRPASEARREAQPSKGGRVGFADPGPACSGPSPSLIARVTGKDRS